MNAPVPEFSRMITVTRVSPQGVEEILEAKPAERAALAERFDLVEVSSLKAQLTVLPGAKQTFVVTGVIDADIVQRCVVTLDPVASHVHADAAVIFVPEQAGLANVPADNLEDEFELFSGGKIDLGEMVAQQLGINLDPYPRKAGAVLPLSEFPSKSAKIHPFAALAEAAGKKKKPEKTED